MTNGLAGFLITTLTLIPFLCTLYMLIHGKMQLHRIFFPTERKLIYYFYSVPYLLIFFLPFIYAILTTLHTNTGCCEDAQWYFGLLAFILCCANFLRLLSKFPFIGQKSIIYYTILWTFLKLLVFGIFLLLASAIVLMVIFFDPQATVSVGVG